MFKLEPEDILTHQKALDKKQAIKIVADRLQQRGYAEAAYFESMVAREAEISVYLGSGVAIPHGQRDSGALVLKTGVVVGLFPEGVLWDEGEKAYIVIGIAAKEKDHMVILQKIGSLLEDEKTVRRLAKSSTPAAFKEAFEGLEGESAAASSPEGARRPFLIGVTGCAAGIAHTYIAAENLKKAAQSAGFEMKVETLGSIGAENTPTAEEIRKAVAVVIACDTKVDLERFVGKKVLFTSSKEGIHKAEELIRRAVSDRTPLYEMSKATKLLKGAASEDSARSATQGIYSYLMNGVSYMIPFVVVGGLLVALSLAIGGEPTPDGLKIPQGSLWNQMLNVGVVGFQLMIPILSGFIALAIADRSALAPGMIGGWVINNGAFFGADAGAGFLGAIVVGFLAGYIVKAIKTVPVSEMIRPLMPVVIIPVLGTGLVAAIVIFILGAPIAGLMHALNAMLSGLSTGSVLVMGIVMGLMQGFDYGGPIGKVVFLFSVGMIGSGHPEFMGALACSIPVAPLGMGAAALLGRRYHLFNEAEYQNGKAALAMGLVGISEGAIPFAAADPIAVIPATMIGSAVGMVLGFLFGITNQVAHGGPVVALLGAVNKPVLALLAMAVGTVATVLCAIVFKGFRVKHRVSVAKDSPKSFEEGLVKGVAGKSSKGF